MDDYAREFRHAHLTTSGPAMGLPKARDRLRRLREAVRGIAPGAVSDKPSVPADLARFLARADAFLRELGRVHHYSPVPLFGQP